MIDNATIAMIDADVSAQYDKMGYRPVVVMIVKNPQGQVLLVQSAKSHASWGFPQGGVNRGESVLSAVRRELAEETGIRQGVKIVKFCGMNQIAMPGREKRDGFTSGKRYYYFYLVCDTAPTVVLQAEELADYCWKLPAEVPEILSTLNEEKRETLLRALTQS